MYASYVFIHLSIYLLTATSLEEKDISLILQKELVETYVTHLVRLIQDLA